LLSLLQSPSLQIVSAEVGGLKKPRFRAVLRAELDTAEAERAAVSLSDRLSLSEAWGLANLLYKLFLDQIQWLDKTG
jgi:hypothetical protein